MFMDPDAPCPTTKSVMKEDYSVPQKKYPAMTRAMLFEKFLWKELYDEYLRFNLNKSKQPEDKLTTEYRTVYGNDDPNKDDENKRELRTKYPLYDSTPITLWNKSGDFTMDFKKRYTVTKPLHLQQGKFAGEEFKMC